MSKTESGVADETVAWIQQLTDAALGRSSGGLVTKLDRTRFAEQFAAIDQYADVDTMPTPAGSLAGLKRAVLRLAAFNWARQRVVNRSVLNSFGLLMAELDELRARNAQSERRAALLVTTSVDEARRDLVGSVERSIDERLTLLPRLEARITELTSLVESQDRALADLRTDLVALRTDLLVEQRRVSALRGEIARVRLGDAAEAAGDSDAEELVAHDLDEVYARFEAAFRPSTKELEDRLAEYVPLLQPLAGGAFPVVDVGAGRGEFVALLDRLGIPCVGIDLNPDAVDEARAAGRPVHLAEAIAYLDGLESESVGAITAFHVVEHLSPSVVLRLLDESLRVLRPGGLLVLETPNPTNVTVGAAAFYNDPSHLRPVTPSYLEFLVRDRGYTDVTTRFLHPLPEYDLDVATPDGKGAEAARRLMDDVKWALKGPQDYAVIARRPAGS